MKKKNMNESFSKRQRFQNNEQTYENQKYKHIFLPNL
jgi:hypothetical protein